MRKISKEIPLFDHELFLSKISITKNDCWSFNGAKRNGYGIFSIKIDKKWSIFYSHRLSFSMFNKITSNSDSMVIDHICKNRECVNPDHLRETTSVENVMINSFFNAAVNKEKKTCKRGHDLDGYNRKYNKRFCKTCALIRVSSKKDFLAKYNKEYYLKKNKEEFNI